MLRGIQRCVAADRDFGDESSDISARDEPDLGNLGDSLRELRHQRGVKQADLAARMSVSVSYISKVENGKLHFGDYPSEKFIHKLSEELKADEDELLLLADKVPASIRQRIRQRPGLFQKLAAMDKRTLDALEASIEIRK